MTTSKVCSKALPDSTEILGYVVFNHENNQVGYLQVSSDDTNDMHHHQRNKRAAYDPYDVYYYYPKSLNGRAPAPAPRYDPYEAQASEYVSRREGDESNRIESQNGQKYKYTPLFQYKSTQSRRRKLFVPNLFG